MPQRAGYNNTGGVGLVIGAAAFGAFGFVKWGMEGLLLALIGAVVGTMGETALTAGREGRASLLLALTPLAVFAFIAYWVWRYFK
jgi:hypothetical protein